MNPLIDNYLLEGCGRCPKGGTPECKVHTWPEELRLLRSIVLDCGLMEELKWGVPCYTYKKKNVLIVAAFKEYCSISFFKGSLLKDPKKILSRPGDQTQGTRIIKFTSVGQITKLMQTLKSYIHEAMEIEKIGMKVDFKAPSELDIPIEFKNKLKADKEFKRAFEALTPGRQKAYILFFAGAKQSKTREARIEKYVQQILEGRGMFD
jgi:uncharacterized protein YdeI (YjbR/CyaY-like superfamily)